MQKPHMLALEKQLDIIRLWRSPMGISIGEGYSTSLQSKEQRWTGAYHQTELAPWMADHLDQTETYWAADEMIALVEHAAETYDGNEPLIETDLPTRTGFVFMEDSRHFIDRWGDKLGYRYFTWWVTSEPRRGIGNTIYWVEGVEVAFYTDPRDPSDIQMARMPESVRRTAASLVHIAFWPFDYSVQNLIDGSEEARGLEPLLAEHEGRTEIDPRALGNAEFMMKFLKTFWRLIQQRIMSVTSYRGHKVMRNARRGGFLAEVEDVKVITLRRYKEPQDELRDTEGNVVEWSHRWIVDGHWRNQYYASLGLHRQIYIAPHIKGPEDRPLIVKDKVFKWSR